MTLLPWYLIIGQALGMGFYFWAGVYCWRFVGNVKPRWSDLAQVALIYFGWPIVGPVFGVMMLKSWRFAMRNQRCLCNHVYLQHDDGQACLASVMRIEFFLSGEGAESAPCECPKFNAPKVRR